MSLGPVLAPHRSGRLRRPDCDLYHEVTGAGPPIVFAHGLGGSHLSWWQQVPVFAPHHACVSFAHRGFAPSSSPPGGPDPRDHADDLAALCDALALHRPVLVAQSMGGWGAVEFALRHPGRLRGLVLAATTGTVDPARIGGPQRARLDAWTGEAAARVTDWAARGIHPATGERMAVEQPALAHLYRSIDALNAGLDKAALRARLWAARTRAPAELSGIGCPVLFVSGAEDAVIPPFAADAIAALLPHARVVHVPDAGHSVYFERAAVFNQALRDFIAALPA